MNSIRKMSGLVSWVCRPLVYLCLPLFVVWHVGWAGYKASQFFKSPVASGDGVCSFDSFSQPAIASSILKQEADRLFLLYIAAWDRAPRIQNSQLKGSSESENARQSYKSAVCANAPGEPTLAEAATIKPLEDIHRSIRGLNAELDRKFLSVYFRTERWDDFLSCYLELLKTEPATATVVSWEWCALTLSQRCGRTEELCDVLAHVIRFHPELKTIGGLRSTLDDWNAAHTASADK